MTSSVLAAFGVSEDKLTPQMQKFPATVPGRIAHIDADFMAYQVSAESKEELDPENPVPRKTLEDMKHNAKEAADYIRRMAGAEKAVLHVTQSSDKGGRYKVAIQKEYQANRQGREVPEHLETIRFWLGQGFNNRADLFEGVIHTDQEADDGMAQAHFADPENAIICSKDKDLMMVPGMHLDMDNFKVIKVDDPFGSIWIDDTKSSKKLVGQGTKFFWAQCLMGDTADNIQGLPEMPGSLWQEYSGTAEYKRLHEKFVKTTDKAEAELLDKKMKALHVKTKKCGPVLTYDVLATAGNDRECYYFVKEAYERLAKEHGYQFKHWLTLEPVTPTQALFSEMQLLWMRRTKDKLDVLNWLKGVLGK